MRRATRECSLEISSLLAGEHGFEELDALFRSPSDALGTCTLALATGLCSSALYPPAI